MKLIHTHPEKTILSVVKKYVEYIAPTYGPAGKKILIINSEFSHEAVDDGKRASQAFEIENEFENAVAQYIKETTQKGIDGTTTAGLIMGNIVLEVFKDLDDELKTHDFHGLALGLRKGLEEAVEKITKASKKIKTKEELYAIALNSYKNEEIAKLIADTVFKIGKDGVMAIEDSQTTSTTCEVVQGLEINKGYLSPYLINNEDRTKVVLKNPVVLLINKRVEQFAEIVPILKQIGQRPITIIAEGFSEGVLNSVIAQRFVSQGNFSPLLLETPNGDKLESLRDIGVIVGANVMDGKVLTLDKATLNDLGEAQTIEATKDKTKILGGKGGKPSLSAYIERLKIPNDNKFEQDKLNKRIAQLLGGIAVIKVGAYTDNELKGMKTKVENAVKSTQLAFKSGVVSGAGKALADIKTSSELLNEALKAPRKQLELNGKQYLDEDTTDPTEVVTIALTTAVSIAEGLITMGGISVPKRKKDKDGDFA